MTKNMSEAVRETKFLEHYERVELWLAKFNKNQLNIVFLNSPILFSTWFLPSFCDIKLLSLSIKFF